MAEFEYECNKCGTKITFGTDSPNLPHVGKVAILHSFLTEPQSGSIEDHYDVIRADYGINSVLPQQKGKKPRACHGIMQYKLIRPQRNDGIKPVIQEIPSELITVVYSSGEQPEKRSEVASVMQIEDKGHKTHGSNFDGNQNLKQIIDNLFAKVFDGQKDTVAQRVITAYGYDPR